MDKLNTSSKNVYFNIFLASQVKANDRGFLSRDILVRELLEIQSDIHHIFPQNYLEKEGISDRKIQSQIANLVVMERNINNRLGDTSPVTCFSELQEGCKEGQPRYGGIDNSEDLCANLKSHSIPFNGVELAISESYNEFLEKRRKLMAKKIRNYFESL